MAMTSTAKIGLIRGVVLTLLLNIGFLAILYGQSRLNTVREAYFLASSVGNSLSALYLEMLALEQGRHKNYDVLTHISNRQASCFR